MGKYARGHYDGPQLDFSAFEDLVNHQSYKSVFQLSPTPSKSNSESRSESRSSDSDSISSQGSPHPPAKRKLSLQAVQEVNSDPEDVTFDPQEVTYSSKEVPRPLEHPVVPEPDFYVESEPIRNISDQGLNSNHNPDWKGEVSEGNDLIKPPSPFAEQDYVQQSSPVDTRLPPIGDYTHIRQPSGDSQGYYSAYGSLCGGESKTPSHVGDLHSPKHIRDNSYDSLISEDRNSGGSSLPEDRGQVTSAPSDPGALPDPSALPNSSALSDPSSASSSYPHEVTGNQSEEVLHNSQDRQIVRGYHPDEYLDGSNSLEGEMPVRYDQPGAVGGGGSSGGASSREVDRDNLPPNIRYSATFDAVYDQEHNNKEEEAGKRAMLFFQRGSGGYNRAYCVELKQLRV